MKKTHKVLIVASTQFGYHIDTFMYCKKIDSSKFEMHYVGFDLGYDRIQIKDIHVHYIKLYENKIVRHLYYLSALYQLNRNNQFDLVFHVHTKFSLIIRLIFLFNRYIFDIRTGDLSNNGWQRKIKNYRITLLSKLSSNVSVISEGLANQLHIGKQKAYILPLGGEINNVPDKIFSSIHLLYVGTLSKRNIYQTVEGLALFLKEHSYIKIQYDIVGSGYETDIKKLKKSIENNNLDEIVRLYGYIKHTELSTFFYNSNIGIVYIPQKGYYQNQPSTKLYEYLLAGMPVIATNTTENRKKINPANGVICEDDPTSFSNALVEIYKNKFMFNSDSIRNKQLKSSWNEIVEKYLEPYFTSVIAK